MEFLVPLLETRSEPIDNGWPEVKPDDVTILNQTILAIIMAKWGPDPDGVLPIEFKVVDRTRYWSPVGTPLRYEHKAESLKELLAIFNAAIGNATGNMEALKNVLNSVDARLARVERESQPE